MLNLFKNEKTTLIVIYCSNYDHNYSNRKQNDFYLI